MRYPTRASHAQDSADTTDPPVEDTIDGPAEIAGRTDLRKGSLVLLGCVLLPGLALAGFVLWLVLKPPVPVAGPGCSDPRGHAVARTRAGGDSWTVVHLDDHTMAQCDGTVAYTRVTNLPGGRWQDSFSWRFDLAMTGPVRCGFSIYIPGSHGGGAARYYVGQVGGDPVGEFTVDQQRYARNFPFESPDLYESPEFRLPDPHRIQLVLVNAGHGTYTVVAAAAVPHCTPA
jgi:hypothetical protein